MAICKKKVNSSIIWFHLPSSASDIDCSDGEVASFRNVDWLSQTSSDTNAGNSGSSSTSSKPSDSSTRLRIITSPTSVILPSGSRLLAIHSPENLHGGRRYLFLAENDALAVYIPDVGVTYLPGTVSRTIGDIRKILLHGNVIMIIGSITSAYILYNPQTDRYSLTTKHPTPPNVTFSTTPAHIERYTRMAGAMPELSVTLDLPLSVAGSQTAISNWLDNGHSSSVSEDVIERVYKSVGSAVEKYISEIRAMGYLLTPAIGIASIDDFLPSFPTTVETNYRPPFALLQSWNYNAEKLTLKLEFSLLPLSLNVQFRRNENEKIWDSEFSEIRYHISDETEWRYNASETLTANGYTSYTDPLTGQRTGFAFRFPSLSLSEMQNKVRSSANSRFRTVGKSNLENSSEGIVTLKSATSEDPVFTPHFNDNRVPRALNGASIDSGFVLWDGEVAYTDENGVCHTTSLEKKILVSHPTCPIIFRYLCSAGEGGITAVMQGNGTRSTGETGRHPLYAISTDGVRRLTADGEGGYLNASLLTHEGTIPHSLSAQSSDRIYYSTSTGIRSLGLDGSLKVITRSPIEEDWEEMKILRDSETILLRKTGGCLLISEDGERFDIRDIAVRRLCDSEGTLFMTESSGAVTILKTEKYNATELTDNETSSANAISAEFREQTTSTATLTTRPLKMASALSYKSIRGIRSLSPDIGVVLEGSNDKLHWSLLAEFRGSINTLRLSPYQFYRITLTTTSDPILLRCIEIFWNKVNPDLMAGVDEDMVI